MTQPLLDAAGNEQRHLLPRSWINAGFRLVAILVILAAITFLVLSMACYTDHRPGDRTNTEIAALSAALESYKADHGSYPTDPQTTELLNPNTSFNPRAYVASSEFLYRVLSGKAEDKQNRSADSPGNTVYISFRPNQLKTAGEHTYVVDQWGNSLGYSTFKAAHSDGKKGNDHPYDLWSTHGGTHSENQSEWITNW